MELVVRTTRDPTEPLFSLSFSDGHSPVRDNSISLCQVEYQYLLFGLCTVNEGHPHPINKFSAEKALTFALILRDFKDFVFSNHVVKEEQRSSDRLRTFWTIGLWVTFEEWIRVGTV